MTSVKRKVTPTIRASGHKQATTSDEGRRVLADVQRHKNDVIGHWRKRTGRGSSIGPGLSPTRRYVWRNGRLVEILTPLGRALSKGAAGGGMDP